MTTAMTMSRSIALLLVLVVLGCARTDPYQRTGMWRPNDANAANLRSQVTVPLDLARATPASRADGGMAAAAAARLRTDRVRPLLDSGLAQVVAVGGGAAPPPPAAPAAASTQ